MKGGLSLQWARGDGFTACFAGAKERTSEERANTVIMNGSVESVLVKT